MRKLIYSIVVLLPLAGAFYVLQTKEKAQKKQFLMLAPSNESGCGTKEESKKVEEPSAAPVAPKVVAPKKERENEANKKNKQAKKEGKKETKQTFAITDSFHGKERHQPGTLGYHKFFTWFYPTLFVLKLNDQEVVRFDGSEFTRPTKEITIDPNQPLKAHFDWEFLHGRKKGWRTTEFKLDPEIKSINIGFDWKDEWQVKIDQAKPIPESDKSSDNSNVDKK